MRFLVVLAAFVTISVALSGITPVDLQFRAFMLQYGKSYATPEEQKYRKQVFAHNLERAARLNEEHEGLATFGVTPFSDLTAAEFKDQYLMKNLDFDELPARDAVNTMPRGAIPSGIPAFWDWTINKTNICTAVKNQEQCGSCWAFSATEAIESTWAAQNPLAVLGPQQIVDCDTQDSGCNGGWPMTAYAYVQKAGGQETEASYPYTAQDGTCKFDASKVVAKISGWGYVITSPAQENTTLLSYIASTAPASICVYAEPWQLYNGGIITKGCSSEKNMIDHCVQLTGFGVNGTTPYWRIRNSWGTQWGEQGFIRVMRGKDLCCVAQVVTNPKL